MTVEQAASGNATLAATLKNLPNRPGVYLLKNARGDVLYVGKAASLRSRVRSYWQKDAPGAELHLIRSVIDRGSSGRGSVMRTMVRIARPRHVTPGSGTRGSATPPTGRKR